MTNTLYSHSTIRDGDGDGDDSSSTTTEESLAASRRHTPLHHPHHHQQLGVVPAAPPPWIAGFNAWIPTNTQYLHNTIRDGDGDEEGDDDSSTTAEESAAASRRHTLLYHRRYQQPGVGHMAPVAPPPGIAGFNAWIPTKSGFNPESENSYDSSEISSLGSISPTCLNECGQWQFSSHLKSFSFKELRSATKKFHVGSVLREGSFGKVFKGRIDENKLTATKFGMGTAVAIERLSESSYMGDAGWRTVVKYMGKLCHPNLERLFGYCLDNEERLLVYEFMPRGSLENHLFRRDSSPLPWGVRMKIALGVAKGLAFLHSAAVNVIHRDVKSSNILLDKDYNAKLTDFALAVDGPTGDESYISTAIEGTFGYAAPEYLATGHLTTKCDVYNFGVVLLEMLSGRRTIDHSRSAGVLVEWAKPYLNHERKIYGVVDSRLEGQYSSGGARTAANLALQCLSMDAKLRPKMDDVVKTLEEL